jgi:hypothetical protein
MTTRGALVRVGAVISSIVLVALYVAYRSRDAAADATSDATPSTASPVAATAPVAGVADLLPGSKSARVVGDDRKVVYTDSPTNPATQPSAGDIRLMSSSKSAAVIDRADARRLTRPATQPAH